jgi:hypothetical protein
MDGTPAPVYRTFNLNGPEQLSVQAPFSLAGKNPVPTAPASPAGQ